MTSALSLLATSVTFSWAFRIGELTSTHSQLAGRVKVKSLTLKVVGASAAKATPTNSMRSAKQAAVAAVLRFVLSSFGLVFIRKVFRVYFNGYTSNRRKKISAPSDWIRIFPAFGMAFV